MLQARWSFLLLTVLTTSAVAGHDHSDVRRAIVSSHLAQAGENPVVFMGDSITESALLPSHVCGLPIVNAGVGGVDAATYMQFLKGVPPFKASAIVVAIGTNSALREAGEFEANYLKLRGALLRYSDQILFAGLPPIEDGALSEYFDAAKSDRVNASIQRIAGDDFIDLRSELNRHPVTRDGIHLSAVGYTYWLDAVISKLRRKLGC